MNKLYIISLIMFLGTSISTLSLCNYNIDKELVFNEETLINTLTIFNNETYDSHFNTTIEEIDGLESMKQYLSLSETEFWVYTNDYKYIEINLNNDSITDMKTNYLVLKSNNCTAKIPIYYKKIKSNESINIILTKKLYDFKDLATSKIFDSYKIIVFNKEYKLTLKYYIIIMLLLLISMIAFLFTINLLLRFLLFISIFVILNIILYFVLKYFLNF